MYVRPYLSHPFSNCNCNEVSHVRIYVLLDNDERADWLDSTEIKLAYLQHE